MPIIKQKAPDSQAPRHTNDSACGHARHRERQHMVQNHLIFEAPSKFSSRMDGGPPSKQHTTR